MIRLADQHFPGLRPLFAGLRFNLVVDSILDGNTPAWVFADQPAGAALALLWNRQDALLLAGTAGDPATIQALHAIIAGEIVPDARRRHIPELALFCDLPAWEPQLGGMLAGLPPQPARRRYYSQVKLGLDWRDRLPGGCSLLPIDEALLGRQDLANVNHVAGWVGSFWASNAAFVRTGFGYCLLAGEAVASWCLAVYASRDQFELGLATMPAQRGRGFATITAAACVEHCLARGWRPHWHCWEENRPSIAVAEKVGFAGPVGYDVVRFAVPAGD